MSEEAVVRRGAEIPFRRVEAGTGTSMQVLIGASDGVPNFTMRRFVMEDEGGMPLHTNRVEHEQYVLRGRAEIRVGEELHSVSAGDVLFIPAGTPHSYRVVAAPFEFLCMVPNREDEIEILRERKGDES
ncbi:MAG: cupin domain-containing protein [Thermoanaerobaculia bacterium]|nr:cupin domain-containing protein [Thermoanaerobaculia bacterium]